MGLAGKSETLIPGYKIYLCTQEELPEVRHRIEVERDKRLDAEIDAINDEEWKEFWAEEKERSRVKRQRERQELLQRQTKLATEAGRPAEAGLITDEEWSQTWKDKAAQFCLEKGKAATLLSYNLSMNTKERGK